MKTIAKITIAIGILCLFAFAQTKPKAAVYIIGNPEGRDALKMAVNNFLIKSQKYQMIAVDAIDVVAKEQKRQRSGSVTDSDIALLGRDAGAEYVCVVERTELDGISYVATRMVSVQSKVAELADMTELPRGGKMIELIEWQIGSMLGMPVGPRPKAEASAQANYTQPTYAAPAQTAPTVRTEPAMQGIIVPGGSLAQKLLWLQKSADSHETYIIEVNADESITPYTFEFKGAVDITVVLRGVGGNRTIRLKSNSKMFTVRSDVTLILDNDITLMGHKSNTDALVNVEEKGEFKMNAGASIAGNNASGVYVREATFTMSGGTISGNNAKECAGVNVGYYGTFIMSGGSISGNNASDKGGGICCLIYGGTCTMRGGTITGNTAVNYGGGVLVGGNSKFTKTGGIITGYKNDQTNGNIVRDAENVVLSRRGHAVYISENKRKETTAGTGVNINSQKKGAEGGWDE